MTSIANSSSPPCCSGCDPGRRQALQQLAAGALSLGCGWAAAATPDDAPRAGDWLVPADADNGNPLTVADLKANSKQLIAWPHDPAAKRNRDGSRLNRVLLVKLDPAALDAETAPRAAEGVLAYSSICTHQGCDVSAWRTQEKTLLCFCHFSQFQPAAGAKVVAGPAPRPLPWLPLKSEGGRLVIAGGFNQPPGGHQS
ncbi:MAG: Rieske 2Fe-2S domain-containing protein [Piscinibacter sp.]